MARNPNTMRGLSITHIVIGILLFGFGIADRVLVFPLFIPLWPSNVYFGIWIGIWMCITGIIGIIASGRERTGTGTAFTGIFLGFSIVSVLFALAIIGSYGYILAAFWPLYWYFLVRLVIAAALFLLGIAEFIIGIWAAVSGCQACCDNTPAGQVILAPSPAGYVMNQGPDGGPVAIPMQVGGAVQGFQPPMMMTSTAGEVILAPNPAGYVMTQGPVGAPVAAPVQAGGVVQGAQPPMMMTSTAGEVTGKPGSNQTSSSETNYTGYPSTQYDIRL